MLRPAADVFAETSRDEPLEVAIVNGAHPLFYLGCGMWKGPIDTDEYDIVGGFYGEPMETVHCKTVDLDVPANAEVVIEGVIPPNVSESEGPFGEFTGYASHNSTQHRIDVTAITRREDAIWQDIVSGLSAEHNGALRVPQEARIYRALKAQLPQHRRLARWTLPLWLYVSVTGVVIYVMLYQLYPVS